MAFLKIDKKTGNYLRIVEFYRLNGKPTHKTIHFGFCKRSKPKYKKPKEQFLANACRNKEKKFFI